MIFTESKKLFHWRRVKRNKKEYAVCKQVLVYTVFGLGASAVQAGPTGGEITGGSGTISQSGTTTDILQATKRLDINWETFSSLPDETINFLQPNSIAVAINRVIGGVPSSLEGALNANGRVFILNQAGIVFHKSGVVNVAGLLATTAANVDVDGDKWNFSGTGYGAVLNHGQINISNGGFAVLAAPYVENTGAITANLGQIQLASTNTYTMDLRGDGLITFSIPDEAVQQIEAEGKALGVNNSGTLQARSGVVGMTAKTASDLVAGAVNLSGVIDAESFDTGMDGGNVQLVSKGDINFTGSATVSVNGGVNGDGGEIKTWADGVNRFNAGATISARGGDEAGNGGFIELSGRDVRVRGDIDAGAPNGEAGTFTLDPDRINIAQGTGGSASFIAGSVGSSVVNDDSSGTATVFERKIEAIALTGTKVKLEADDFIYMANLSVGATPDGVLDVSLGGIEMRVTNADVDNFNRIWFDNKNNTIRSTTGDITIEVFGTNGSATGTMAGAEIDIGNINAGGINVANAGDVFINAPSISANVNVGDVTVFAHFSNSPTTVVTTVLADLDINAGGNITVNGPISVVAELHNPNGSGGIRNALSDVNITADGNITLTDGIEVRSLVDIDSGVVGAILASADLDMSASGYIDVTNAVDVSALAQISGSANLVGLTRTKAFATIDGDMGVYLDDVSVLASDLNAGNNPGGQEGTADLDIIAGGTASAGIDIDGNVSVTAINKVFNAQARNEVSAYADLIARNNITVGGSNGVSVIASATNLDHGGFIKASADLHITAGTNGTSGYIDIAAGGVNVEANTRYEQFLKNLVDADALATLTAYNDITINGDIRIQTNNIITYSDGDGPSTAVGGPDGRTFANAQLVVNAGTGGTDGDFYVGGLTEVNAFVTKSFNAGGGAPPFGGSGTASANASANISAAYNVDLVDGISVNAIDTVTTASGFLGATAGAYLNINAGTAGTGNITVGNFLEVIASIQADGSAAASGANANATAIADLFAPDEVNIGYGSSSGITVQAIANNQLTGNGVNSAIALADLDIHASGNTINIYGPGLTQAVAVKVAGSGSAVATADASITDVGNITIYGGGFDVLATASAAGAGSSYAAIAVANLKIESTAGYIDIDGPVTVDAYAFMNKVGDNLLARATASADLDAYGDITINGAFSVMADAELGSNVVSGSTAFASAIANLNAGGAFVGGYGDITISGDVTVEAVALNQAAVGFDADATAGLYMFAMASASSNYGNIRIGGDLAVTADARLLNADFAGSSSVTATAIAELTAQNSLYIGSTAAVNGVEVEATAYADGTSNADGPGVLAVAELNIEVGSGVSGTFPYLGNVEFGGPVNVSAYADQLTFNAGFHGAFASAEADFEVANNLTIDGGITVFADAFSDAVGSSTRASAQAGLFVDAGTAASPGLYGDFTVNSGGILVQANAVAMNGYDSNDPISVFAHAITDIEANYGNITIDGTVNVLADARFSFGGGSGGSAFGSGGAIVAATAEANLAAGYDVAVNTGGASTDTGFYVGANAFNLATGNGYAGTAYALAAADIDAGTSNGTGSITITGDFNVDADAYLAGPAATVFFGSDNYAAAMADLTAANDVTVNGDINVTATARNETSYNVFFDAFASADLDIAAGTASPTGVYASTYGFGDVTVNGRVRIDANAFNSGNHYLDIDASADADAFITAFRDIYIENGLTINAEAHVGTGASYFADANADAAGYLFAGRDITSYGEVDITATAINYAGDTDGFYGLFGYGGGEGTANAFLLGIANIEGNGGNIWFGDGSNALNVQATTNVPYASEGLIGPGNVSADATAILIAQDITLDGDVTITAEATTSTAFSNEVYVMANATGLFLAGPVSGYGNITINGDTLVSARADLYGGGTESARTLVNASADVNMIAAHNINITGNIDVLADTFAGSVYGASSSIFANAELDIIAGVGSDPAQYGGDFTMTGNITVDANITLDNDVYALFGADNNPSASATLTVDAYHDISIDGSVTVNATGFITSNVMYGNNNVSALASADFEAGRNITVTNDITVTALASNNSNGAIYGQSPDADAVAILDMNAGSGYGTGFGGYIDIGGNVLVDAQGIMGPSGGIYAEADAYALADIRSYAGDITVGGDIDVTALAMNTAPYAGSGTDASAFLYMNAGEGFSSGDYNLTIFGDVNVTADAIVENMYADEGVFALASAQLFADDDINISFTGAGDYAINVTANAQNLGAEGYFHEGTASAVALLNIEAGYGSHGGLNVYGGMNISATALNDYASGSFGAFALASADITAADNITILGATGDNINVLADADNINGTANGFASAGAYLNIAAGTHGSSGNLYVDMSNIVVSADADADIGDVLSYVSISMTAADNLTLYGDNLTVVNAVSAYNGDASAFVDFYLAAGTHGGSTAAGNLNVNINTILVSADADVTGLGYNAFASADVTMHAADNLTLTADSLTVQAFADASSGYISINGSSETAVFANAYANASLYLAAGTHGSDGSMTVSITNTLVYADALAGNIASATADASATFTAADNLTFTGDYVTVLADADVGNGVVTTDIVGASTTMESAEFANVNAVASLYMAAGTHAQFASTSGYDLNAMIAHTLVSADALAGNIANASATADAVFKASRNVSFTGTDINVLAYAEVGNGVVTFNIFPLGITALANEADAQANASLYMAAGTHGSDGYMMASIDTTLVSADALALDTANATAGAYATFTAADDLTFTGDYVTVLADADVGSGALTLNVSGSSITRFVKEADAVANASLYMAAGTHAPFASSAGYDLGANIAHTLVSADALALNFANASATAEAVFKASRNVSFTGTDINVQAYAEVGRGVVITNSPSNASATELANEADANAHASLYMAAGTHGSDGYMVTSIDTTLVFADALALNMANATAEASATFTAADNLTFTGDYLTVLADADVGNGEVTTNLNTATTTELANEADANANASLYMAAGTHAQFASTSGYDLSANIAHTLVSAEAAGFNTANANATAEAVFKASRNVTFTGTDINVLAYAEVGNGVVTTDSFSSGSTILQSAEFAQANADATLYMAAGTHGSDGYLDATITNTLVSADAAGFNTANATAEASATFTAADNLTFTGDYVTVLADADVGNGVLTFNVFPLSNTELANEADANANASLYMAAGTHAQFASTSGYDLSANIAHTLVSAEAAGFNTANANATAEAVFKASRNVSFTGTDINVLAYAEVGNGVVTTDSFSSGSTILQSAEFAQANADATLYMAAGTHGSDGYLDATITNTLVSADAAGFNTANATAEASATFTAADNLTFTGDYVTVLADADVGNGVVTTNTISGSTTEFANEADANANASLYMAAGTHAQFASTSGYDLSANIAHTLVSAEAAGFNTANANATAEAVFKASRNVTFTGTDINVLAYAEVGNGVVTTDSFSSGSTILQSAEFAQANADATLYMAAGTHGSDGYMVTSIDTTLVFADALALNTANATAEASATFTAANNLTFTGDYLTVLADADVGYGVVTTNNTAGVFITELANEADANANASLYMAAGTHAGLASTSGYNLDVGIAYTLLSADALAGNTANANATADAVLKASRNVTFTGTAVQVQAYADVLNGVVTTNNIAGLITENANEADANANASLYMAAGTHGSDGYLDATITNTLVSADALALNTANATAEASATFTAADNLTFTGDYLTVLADADVGYGVVTTNNTAGVIITELASEADANAHASLYMAAGTHAQFASSAGYDLGANIAHTLVSADALAGNTANATATADAVFKASRNVSFTGTDINVLAYADVLNGVVTTDNIAGLIITENANEADANANASLYMAAGTHGSDGYMVTSIDTTLVAADAEGLNTANATANAEARFTAADNLTFTGDYLTVLSEADVLNGVVTTNSTIGNITEFANEADANANASLYMAAGTHAGLASTSGYNLDVGIAYTLLSADAAGLNTANANATADAVFKASRNVSFTGTDVTVQAYAEVGYGVVTTIVGVVSTFETANEADANANASLYMAAGTHGSDGSLTATIDTTLVSAVAAGFNTANATAEASATFTAADNLTFTGDYLTVLADADVGYGVVTTNNIAGVIITELASEADANAHASLYMAAGTHAQFASSAGYDLGANIAHTLVSADALAGNTANATATADAVFKASRNVSFTGTDVTVQAYAEVGYGVVITNVFGSTSFEAVNEADANANASLYMAAGTHGSSGNLFADFSTADVYAAADGNFLANATADASAKFTAANDAGVYGFAITVRADAEVNSGTLYGINGSSSQVAYTTANADASLYMAAGTHAAISSNGAGDLYAEIQFTEVNAVADADGVFGNASANADAVFKASRNADIIIGEDITVSALAFADNGGTYGGGAYVAMNQANATASLYMAAGTHGSSGNLFVDIDEIMEVTALADGDFLANAAANASATFTAASNATVYGEFFLVDAEAETESGTVFDGSNYVAMTNAIANASLYMAAGTHATSGGAGAYDLFVDVDFTDVAAFASVDGVYGNASANADAVFKASRDVDFTGETITVGAEAFVDSGVTYGGGAYVAMNQVNATASLYMAAGTHGSSGNLYVSMSGSSSNIDVYAVARGNALVNATADAGATFTAAHDAGIYAFAISVNADAEVDSGVIYGTSNSQVAFTNADAEASLYMAAGTHAIFNSSGVYNLLVDVDFTNVYASASANNLGNAFADADAVMKASRDVEFFGDEITVGAAAFVNNGSVYGTSSSFAAQVNAVADASLYLAAGTHGSDGSLVVDINTADVYAIASGSNMANATADAGARLTAADDAEVYAFAINVRAGAFNFNGVVYGSSNSQVAQNNANAAASLYVAAGTHAQLASTSGADLYVGVATTLVDASAHAFDIANATADASAVFKASRNVTFYGDTVTVEAGAGNFNGVVFGSSNSQVAQNNANAAASLYLAAGTHGSSGNLSMIVNTTDVYAVASGDFLTNATADASAKFTAADDGGIYGVAITVDARAEVGSGAVYGAGSSQVAFNVADANASLYMAAGTHADSGGGNLFVGVDDITVSASATGSDYANVIAGVQTTFKAGTDIIIGGDSLNVWANAFTFYGTADASAALYMTAGTHSNGSLFVDINGTLVSASAIVDTVGNAYADAGAIFTAAYNVTITGNTLEVSGQAVTNTGTADADALLYMAAGTHVASSGTTGDLNVDIGSITASAVANVNGSVGNAYADAVAGFYAANDVDITGNSLEVLGQATVYGTGSAIASAALYMAAGTHASTGDLTVSVGNTVVSANADAGNDIYALAAISANAYASAFASLFAGNDITISGGSFEVMADANALTSSLSSNNTAVASASMIMYAGTHGTGDINVNGADISALANANTNAYGIASASALVYGSAATDINVTGTITADANATGSAGQAYAIAGVGLFANSSAINVAGTLTADAFASNNGTASALSLMALVSPTDINIDGDINISAEAVNSFGPATGTGDAVAAALFVAYAGSNIDVSGPVSISADALCNGASGSCDAYAISLGAFLATGPTGDINLSGPINVQSIATANNTGNTASASANLFISNTGGSSGNITLGPIDVLASAIIDHNSNQVTARSFGNATIETFGSNTLNGDIMVSGNATLFNDTHSNELASGQAYLLVRTETGNNFINAGLTVNNTLTVSGGSSHTAGYARLELDAAGSNGSNIAGPGFAIPSATAGGASVTNVMSDIETVGNATAELVIPHIIVTDNELTRRMVITYLEATGFLLPTALHTDSIGDGNGTATGGGTSDTRVLRNRIRRNSLFDLPAGGGFSGFSVDENGNVTFATAFGGLPEQMALPLPIDICNVVPDEAGGILNCGWENEPVFY